MRYNTIRDMDISDGPGVRVSVFLQGCDFNCKNCFNPETHDWNGGKELTQKEIDMIMKACEKDYIKGISILGGEPMHPKNLEATELIAKTFKEKYPTKSVWVWSGFTYEDYLKDKEPMKYIDVIVDGQYVDDLHDFRLNWRGSSNQRVIDVKKSRQAGKVVLYCD